MTREDVYYEAMKTRAPRFDGKFFVGVKTTGIYCRPICPAKPKRENVEFFTSQAAAERAGYRPCLRCRPESAPLSPAWIGKSAVVQRAMRRIQTQDNIDFNEERFAGHFGMSARHLRRLFKEEVGKTPKQLVHEGRLSLARKLIVETELPVGDVALASGFSSIRRFNEAFKDRFQRSPSQIRRVPLSKEGRITISLPYRPPFDFAGLLAFYRSHQVGLLEWFDEDRMHRIFEIDGQLGEITISNNPGKSHLVLEIELSDLTLLPALVARVRGLFDLDADPVLIANALERDRKIKSLLKRFPGIRLPSGWDPFEVAVASILGQFVSLERGRALVRDLIELTGEDSGLVREGHRVRLFPKPEKLAKADLGPLKTSGARKQTLKELARAIALGDLSLEPTQDVDLFKEKILAIRGIGPWTANYMAMKVLRHADAFPETDLILARVLEIHAKEEIERMSPWRGYAAVLFWRAYANQLSKKSRRRKP